MGNAVLRAVNQSRGISAELEFIFQSNRRGSIPTRRYLLNSIKIQASSLDILVSPGIFIFPVHSWTTSANRELQSAIRILKLPFHRRATRGQSKLASLRARGDFERERFAVIARRDLASATARRRCVLRVTARVHASGMTRS